MASMKRLEILKKTGYWVTQIQIALYNCAYNYMKDNNKNRTQLAEHLGVTKGYVTQLLNGDYDHKLSKLVELSLAFGYVPKIDFIPIEEYYKEELILQDCKKWKNEIYLPTYVEYKGCISAETEIVNNNSNFKRIA